MKIYKLSLGKDFFNDQQFNELIQQKFVCVHPDTKSAGRSKAKPGKEFTDAEEGSLFFLCRSADTVELIGFFSDQMAKTSSLSGKDDWLEREFQVLVSAKNQENFNKDTKKWWSPDFRSTFVQIPNDEHSLFEEKILKPVFDIDLTTLKSLKEAQQAKVDINAQKLIRLQKTFEKLSNDEEYLFNTVNSMPIKNIEKLYYHFRKLRNIDQQPVVLLRLRILEDLRAGNKVTTERIQKIKEQITKDFSTDAFRSWTSNFRILYRFFHIPVKHRVEKFLNDLTDRLRRDLNILDITEIRIVTFDGAQNQGQDRIWLAIYNSSHKSQKTAKQLFMNFQFGKVEYGLLDHIHQPNNILAQYDSFDYDHLLKTFRSFVTLIIADDYSKNFEMNTFKNLLQTKKQIILQGPPGTGKTYTAKDIAESMIFGEVSKDKIEQKKRLERSGHFALVQFHPSYSYEDFIRGIVTRTNERDQVKYEVKNKLLGNFAEKADKFSIVVDTDKDRLGKLYKDHIAKLLRKNRKTGKDYYFDKEQTIRLKSISDYRDVNDPNKLKYEVLFDDGNWREQTWLDFDVEFNKETYLNFLGKNESENIRHIKNDFRNYIGMLPREEHSFILIIDEINRANLPSVLGELIYALEYRNEAVDSIYAINGDHSIVIPDNLYIIGTMNTADRSVGHIDYAIKRRFAFVDVLPDENVIENPAAKDLFRKVSELFVTEKEGSKENSDYLAPDFDYKDIQLGHSYFILKSGTEEEQQEELKMKLQYEILPILHEYVKDGILLDEAKEVISKLAL